MFNSIMESARNSTFKNPFVTTVNCESADNSTQSLVAGRTIGAASAVAEGGMHAQIQCARFHCMQIYLMVFINFTQTHANLDR